MLVHSCNPTDNPRAHQQHTCSDPQEKIPKRVVALRNWWAHQDSNLGPMDSHSHGFSTVCGLSHLPRQRAALGSGTLLPVIKNAWGCPKTAASSQVVSAPSESLLSAWLRIAISLSLSTSNKRAVKVSLNSSRSFHTFQYERTFLMSPLL